MPLKFMILPRWPHFIMTNNIISLYIMTNNNHQQHICYRLGFVCKNECWVTRTAPTDKILSSLVFWLDIGKQLRTHGGVRLPIFLKYTCSSRLNAEFSSRGHAYKINQSCPHDKCFALKMQFRDERRITAIWPITNVTQAVCHTTSVAFLNLSRSHSSNEYVLKLAVCIRKFP